MITSFLVIFFFVADRQKKNTQPTKKNTHQQTKLLIQRKHLYAYDMTFLCPPPPPNEKIPKVPESLTGVLA